MQQPIDRATDDCAEKGDYHMAPNWVIPILAQIQRRCAAATLVYYYLRALRFTSDKTFMAITTRKILGADLTLPRSTVSDALRALDASDIPRDAPPPRRPALIKVVEQEGLLNIQFYSRPASITFTPTLVRPGGQGYDARASHLSARASHLSARASHLSARASPSNDTKWTKCEMTTPPPPTTPAPEARAAAPALAETKEEEEEKKNGLHEAPGIAPEFLALLTHRGIFEESAAELIRDGLTRADADEVWRFMPKGPSITDPGSLYYHKLVRKMRWRKKFQALPPKPPTPAPPVPQDYAAYRAMVTGNHPTPIPLTGDH